MSSELSHPPTGLSDAAVEAYHRDGFVIVRGVFSADEIAALDREAEDLLARSELIDTQNIRCR